METKINIAEILKDKSRGTKLYSMIHGKCSFEAVTDEIFKINFCTSKFGLTQSGECTLIKFGNIYDGGECIIFPSKEMRDWSKFSWKKGDVLISNDGYIEVIFDKWYDDTYTSFYCKHYLNSEDKNKIVYYKEFLCTTAKYSLEDKDTAQTYIKAIEERLGSKLNRETLEIENAQPKFKDGDIIKMTWDKYSAIVIFWEYSNFGKGFDSRVFFNIEKKFIECNIHGHILKDSILRLATEEEKKKLFDALAKRGKAWDAEKKELIKIEQNPAWSEEDEEIYRKCICAMRASACGFPEEEKFVEQVDNWFKSLKDRYSWKPSEEQMNTLEYYMHTLICNEHKEVLFGLYADLKKLMEK